MKGFPLGESRQKDYTTNSKGGLIMFDVKKKYIYQNGNIWRGKLDYTLNGKSFTKWFRGNTYAGVNKKVNNFISGINIDGDISFIHYGDFIQKYYLPFKKISIRPSSYSRLCSVYKYHCYVLGDYALSEISENDCLRIIKKMQNDLYSKSALDKVYEFFNNSFKYAVRSGFIEKNPLLYVPKLASLVTKKNINVYTVDDTEKIEKFLDDKNVNLAVYRYSIPLLYNCGLRIGELLGLRWSDVDLDGALIHIKNNLSYYFDYEKNTMLHKFTLPKSLSGVRVVPLNEKAIYFLNILKEFSSGALVVHNTNGSPVQPGNYFRTVQRLCKSCGVNFKGLHSFRHTFATRLVNCGVNVKTVSVLLGHSNIQTTLDLYVHQDYDTLKTAIDMLSNAVK